MAPNTFTRVLVSNEGTVTSKICAVYANEHFVYDPSTDNSLNPTSYINAKETLWINLSQANIPYDEESYLKMATN